MAPEEGKNKNEIAGSNVQIKEDFKFYDYNSSATIGYLKEYFLSTFGQKYKYCKCLFSLYTKNSSMFGPDKYKFLSNDHKKRLNEYDVQEFYLIKTNALCDCEYKMYTKYINMEKFDIIAKLKDLDLQNKKNEIEIEKLKKSNEKKNSANDKLNKENSKLKNEIEKLKKVEELRNYKTSKFEDFYDIIIDINSIKSVNTEGWKVKFDQKGLDKYNKYKDTELIIISVIGNNNKGKSFLLSKISKIKLLFGTSIYTQGLSVKYPELKGYKGRQLILLDSAGLETPVLKNKKKEIIINNQMINDDEEENQKLKDSQLNKELEENEIQEENKINEDLGNKNEIKENLNLKDKELEQNKEFKENARDKIMTELFIQNFLIKVSDILLIVVGKFTYSEQLLINKIKVEAKKQNKGRIFIIHNLQEFRTVEQVQNYIKEDLSNFATFKLKKRTWITTEKDKENIQENKEINGNNPEQKNKIFEKINEKNVYEDSKLTDVHFTEILNYGDKKKLEVYHLIIANEDSEAGNVYNQYAYNFLENVYNLISEPKKFDIFEQVKENFKNLSDTILNDNIENVSFTENEKILEDKIMKLNFNKELSLKKCYTDELGFSFFKTGDFEPKYNYFKPDENTLEIRLEAPGNTEIDVNHKVEGDETIITVTGKKKKDNSPKELKDNLFSMREFGNFELNIPLKVVDFKINQPRPKEGFPKFVNGVCCIQYELASKGEKATAKPNESL